MTSFSAMHDETTTAALKRLIFLGTGTSHGVPALGCDCRVCTSTNPHNQRTRPSVLLQLPTGNLLIDTTPEMRLQLLRHHIGLVHAILYTHAHADHLFGLDDARLFPRALGGPVPVYCEAPVEASIRTIFSYAFTEDAAKMPRGGVPQLQFHRIAPFEPFDVLGETVLPIRLEHGPFQVLGFRLGNLAYCTDVVRIPAASIDRLQGLDVLVLDALRHEPHPTHFSLSQAIEMAAKLGARQTYFTHISHGLEHAECEATLPAGMRLAYDGLIINF
jgi:phosphoribosyl 1,2-cyclic phosphate phosphodiesterase